jgi:hypothetical protein
VAFFVKLNQKHLTLWDIQQPPLSRRRNFSKKHIPIAAGRFYFFIAERPQLEVSGGFEKGNA